DHGALPRSRRPALITAPCRDHGALPRSRRREAPGLTRFARRPLLSLLVVLQYQPRHWTRSTLVIQSNINQVRRIGMSRRSLDRILSVHAHRDFDAGSANVRHASAGRE